MNDITADTLEQLVTEALERTAFVLVDPAEEADAPLQRHVAIEYEGPTSGCLTLSASDGFLIELASSVLGVDPGEVDAEADGADALQELANILGGSVVNELGGDTQPFSLGLPRLTDAAPGEGDGSIVCRVESDGEPLHICWARAA